MADYRLGLGGVLIRAADGAAIPPDPSNADYQAFLAWSTAGNLPDPGPIGSPVDLTFADTTGVWQF